MPYRLPNLNILCNIFPCNTPNTPGVPLNPARALNVPCQLCHGRRVNVRVQTSTPVRNQGQAMSLLLVAGTDIRGPQDSVSFDLVEVPAGTGRWYWVNFVDDVAKGFTNEYREAGIVAVVGSWIAPYA